MRSDAAANRLRLIEVAREALDQEKSPPLTAIARRAGVGQGTLYRHFPTWPDLLMAVHRSDVDALVATAPGLVERLPAPAALRAWLDRLADYGRLKHGLGAALFDGVRRQLAEEGTTPVVGAIDLLLEAGRRDGTLRDDVDGEDVLQLVGFLWRLPIEGDRDERAAHLLDLVVDGLLARAPSAPGSG